MKKILSFCLFLTFIGISTTIQAQSLIVGELVHQDAEFWPVGPPSDYGKNIVVAGLGYYIYSDGSQNELDYPEVFLNSDINGGQLSHISSWRRHELTEELPGGLWKCYFEIEVVFEYDRIVTTPIIYDFKLRAYNGSIPIEFNFNTVYIP